MSTKVTVEERLAALEREVRDLRTRVESGKPRKDWRSQVYSSLKDVPEFDQVLRLGREMRQADQDEPHS